MVLLKGRAREVTPQANPQQDLVERERMEQALDETFFSGMNAGRSMFQTSDPLSVVKHYAQENEGIVPDTAKTRAWPVFTRALPYSFLTDADLEIIDIQRHIHRIDNLIHKPAYEITHQDIREENLIDQFAYFQAKRAVGFPSTKINERTAQVTQIGQRINTGMPTSGPARKRGALGLGVLGL